MGGMSIITGSAGDGLRETMSDPLRGSTKDFLSGIIDQEKGVRENLTDPAIAGRYDGYLFKVDGYDVVELQMAKEWNSYVPKQQVVEQVQVGNKIFDVPVLARLWVRKGNVASLYLVTKGGSVIAATGVSPDKNEFEAVNWKTTNSRLILDGSDAFAEKAVKALAPNGNPVGVRESHPAEIAELKTVLKAMSGEKK